MSNIRDIGNLDKSSLLDLVLEKDKRIQDLEKLVEDQKRLRLQDSNQVEEKAAKIKEWVTNKLKELENQNKQLREQNKKQKETVESLTNQLASFSPITSPRKKPLHPDLDSVQYIDQAIPQSPIDTIDVNRSLRTRRPQLKKPSINNNVSSSSEEDNQNLRITLRTSTLSKLETTHNKNSGGVSYISIGESPVRRTNLPLRQESPLYDSVNIELVNNGNVNNANNTSTNKYKHHIQHDSLTTHNITANNHHDDRDNSVPPPPPMHQSDRWELELYDLAEKTFSALIRNQDQHEYRESEDSKERNSGSRKSSSSAKNDLISIVRPSFTTIDGNQVVDDNQCSDIDENLDPRKSQSNSLGEQRRTSHDQSSQSSKNITSDKIQNTDLVRTNKSDHNQLSQNLFDSPMRTRTGKDSILRTQSVRRNPAPEKLYDFIATDLVKRGYLVKHGALRNHSRWFVLKNFHLYYYKREAEEVAKTSPTLSLKLDQSFTIQVSNQTNEGYPFKLGYHDKTLLLYAETMQLREEWLKMLTVAINLSDIEPDTLTKHNSSHEGILSMTRYGHSKRCYAILVNHTLFFLKSPIDPTPMSYLSVKGSRIREITDSYDYDPEEQEFLKSRSSSSIQDCSLAIYPKFAVHLEPIYITLGSQQDTDIWFYNLSKASGLDQSSGTSFERTLTQLMLTNLMLSMKHSVPSYMTTDHVNGCPWKDSSVILYSDQPITQPLTSLPNETLKLEAIELFRSIMLFTQVPIEPIAIDYHVSLLQNCLGRLQKYPELRNEFFAQLIKQSTFVVHRCFSSKLSSSGSSGCSSINQRSSLNSLIQNSSECQLITDLQLLSNTPGDRNTRYDLSSTLSQGGNRNKVDSSPQPDDISPPSKSELLQVMQILALAVSLNLPRGRLRWWLVDHLQKFASPDTDIGKYALFTLKSIDRAIANGPRENVPSRTEIVSILLRNPYDHSTPHSLPVSFADNSYFLVGADGSTTIEEFMTTLSKSINIRHSLSSDFYLFADDPSDAEELHILEPQRKILDVVAWWEQASKQINSGRHQNNRAIKLLCRKRLPLKAEVDETDQERLLIVHQVNQEIFSNKIPLNDTLLTELSAIMVQLTFGDFEKSRDPKLIRCILERVATNFLPGAKSGQSRDKSHTDVNLTSQVMEHWKKLSGRTAQDCTRVYLNCIRRLKFEEE